MNEQIENKDSKAPDEETYDFSLVRRELEFRIKDAVGRVRLWKLVELDGTGRRQFMEALESKAKFDKEGNVVGMGGAKDLEVNLLSQCMRDPDGNQVATGVIVTWPSKMQGDLFHKALRLNGFDKESMEAAKNV